MFRNLFLLFFLLGSCVKALADTAAVEDKGKELYLSYGCALCHGRNGSGDGINAQKFNPPPTNFHNSSAYLHGADGDSIRRSVQFGIKEDNSIMPAFEDIPPEELDQIISYLKSLQTDDSIKDLIVSNAWVQAMPPSQTTTAAYMIITNNSQQEAVINSASSDIAGATEIHQMSQINGMMKMAQIPNIHIPAQGKVDFEQGGYHIMLINLKKSVNKGDIVPMTLHFQDGRTIIVNAPAKTDGEEESSSMPGMKM